MKVSDLEEGGIYIDIAGPEILKFIDKSSDKCYFLVLDDGRNSTIVSIDDVDIESDLLEYPEENFKNLLLNIKKESEKCSTN